MGLTFSCRHPHPLICYSFGSAWFPINRLSLVETLLRTLLQADYPFVFAYATELFPVPKYLIDMIKGSENAMAVQVAPQMAVLHHPATGMFLSHCGGNSSSEAIVAGVPMIGMPFAADQGEYCHVRELVFLSGTCAFVYSHETYQGER